MGSAVLLFGVFWIFDVFAWFALLYIVVIISNCPLLCEIHVEPFKTLQDQNFHISPPSPPALYLYIRIYLLCWSRWGGVWWDSLIIQFVVLKIFLKSLSSEEDGEYLNQEAGPKD